MLCQLLVLLHLFSFIAGSSTISYGNRVDATVLTVGKELLKETVPLQMGSHSYELQGLKPYSWYEVKISYPASIPASFSLQLKKENSDSGVNLNRKLLNNEKLIFKTSSLNSDERKFYVLVTVETEGVVAKPNVQERQYIIFNIVCDELLLGIPLNAWWVVVLALLCLGSAFIIPRFLPSYLLLRKEGPVVLNHNVSKES